MNSTKSVFAAYAALTQCDSERSFESAANTLIEDLILSLNVTAYNCISQGIAGLTSPNEGDPIFSFRFTSLISDHFGISVFVEFTEPGVLVESTVESLGGGHGFGATTTSETPFKDESFLTENYLLPDLSAAIVSSMRKAHCQLLDACGVPSSLRNSIFVR